MPDMNPVQRIPHCNPQYRGLFIGTIKVLTHSCRGRERSGARSQCRGNGWTPLLPALVLSSGSSPWSWGGSMTLAI